MPADSTVTLALIASVSAFAMGLLAVAGQALGFWNQRRISREQISATAQLFKNQQDTAAQERAWDIEDRQGRHDKTLAAVKVVEAKAEDAYNEANHTKEQIIKLHEENKEIHQEIKTVLKVAESVKHATGQHKPLEKSDLSALAKEVVSAIRATGPLGSGD